MARIRTVKPEFWSHPVMGRQDDATKCLALALLNLADDEGYFFADPAGVRSFCRPFDDDSTIARRCLARLSEVGWIRVGESASHGLIGWIVNFGDHQKVDRAKRSKIKAYVLVDHSSKARRTFVEGSIPEQGTGNREQGRDLPPTPAHPAAGEAETENAAEGPRKAPEAPTPSATPAPPPQTPLPGPVPAQGGPKAAPSTPRPRPIQLADVTVDQILGGKDTPDALAFWRLSKCFPGKNLRPKDSALEYVMALTRGATHAELQVAGEGLLKSFAGGREQYMPRMDVWLEQEGYRAAPGASPPTGPPSKKHHRSAVDADWLRVNADALERMSKPKEISDADAVEEPEDPEVLRILGPCPP